MIKQNTTLPNLILLLAEVIVFAILGTVAVSHFGLGQGARIMLGYGVAYLIPRIILERARGTSVAARVVLLLIAMLMMAAMYTDLLVWTKHEGYSLQFPDLKADARNYYKWALNHIGYNIECSPVVFQGFPFMMVGLWKLFGLSVVWPQAMNMSFTLTSVVLTGLTTRRLLDGRVDASPQALVTGGITLCGLLLLYLMTGINILKEASTFLSISMAGFALASMAAGDHERHTLWRDIVLVVVACLLMATIRTTYLYFIALGIVIMALPHWRRDGLLAIVLLVFLFVCLMVGDHYAAYSFERHAEIVGGGWNMQRFFVRTESQRLYHDLLDYYFLYSTGHKMLMIPITMAVQFIVPFPWLGSEIPCMSNYVARFNYGWYIVGGIALFYYLFISWRRGRNMGVWAWWPAIIYAGVAYVMAGSMTRYVLPFLPLFVPVTMFVLCQLREGRYRKPFTWFAVVFVLLLAFALVCGLELQRHTFSHLFHTTSLEKYLRNLLL